MDEIYNNFCEVQFLCYQGEPNWLGQLILWPCLLIFVFFIFILLTELRETVLSLLTKLRETVLSWPIMTKGILSYMISMIFLFLLGYIFIFIHNFIE